jgi:hypothetical protein
MTGLATLAVMRPRTCCDCEALLRQQHTQTAMSASSRVLPVHALCSESRPIQDRPLVQIAAKVSGEPILTDAGTRPLTASSEPQTVV